MPPVNAKHIAYDTVAGVFFEPEILRDAALMQILRVFFGAALMPILTASLPKRKRETTALKPGSRRPTVRLSLSLSIFICMYIYIYTHIDVCVYIYIYIYTCTLYIYIYIYIHTRCYTCILVLTVC